MQRGNYPFAWNHICAWVILCEIHARTVHPDSAYSLLMFLAQYSCALRRRGKGSGVSDKPKGSLIQIASGIRESLHF